MKVIILGLKHDKDYYAFYGKNYNIGIKSRKLRLGYPVNTKLVSLFPYNTFSSLDIVDINDPSYHMVYLYAEVKVTSREQKEMASGNIDSCLLKNKQVKLLGEATNPYHDLVNKKNMFINNYFDDCFYDVLTLDFPLFCNEDNQEDFKALIRQYLKRSKYSSDFSITDANFRLFPFLVNLSQDYKITFGVNGRNIVQKATIYDYYQSHKLTLKEFRTLALSYTFNDETFNITIKIALKQGLIDKLSQNDKARLYDSLGEPEDHKASFIENNSLDINDLFKAKYQNYKNNDKEDLKLLKDKSYQPEEEDDYFGDDYEDSWFSGDLQQDIVDDLFTWYPYLDKQLMAKITRDYALRVKKMLEELKNERI